jgi:hypothetical protein
MAASNGRFNYYLLSTGKLIKWAQDKEGDLVKHCDLKRMTFQKVKPPTLKTLERWSDSGIAKATDGCRVEPDGTCEHGCQSWLLVLGFI